LLRFLTSCYFISRQSREANLSGTFLDTQTAGPASACTRAVAGQVGDSLMPLTLLTKLDREAWHIYKHVRTPMLTTRIERERKREGEEESLLVYAILTSLERDAFILDFRPCMESLLPGLRAF